MVNLIRAGDAMMKSAAVCLASAIVIGFILGFLNEDYYTSCTPAYNSPIWAAITGFVSLIPLYTCLLIMGALGFILKIAGHLELQEKFFKRKVS